MLTPTQQILAGLAGLLGGTLSGFFGVGGNVVLIPLLSLTLGLNQHQAQGMTLAALLPPLGLPAVWQYRKAGVPLSWKVVAAACVGFMVAIPLGSALANVLSAMALRLIFAVLLFATAVRTFRAPKEETSDEHSEIPPRFVSVSVLAGFAGGLGSGLLGIGGAILVIPLLRRFLKMSQKQAQLTSLAMLLPPIALPGVLVYAQAQEAMPWSALVPIACGFLVGAFIGASLTRVVSAARLQRGFAVVLLTASASLIFAALR
ncbi:MAG: sulfite exporter TauE/SafE family protein [Archangium sp.]